MNARKTYRYQASSPETLEAPAGQRASQISRLQSTVSFLADVFSQTAKMFMRIIHLSDRKTFTAWKIIKTSCACFCMVLLAGRFVFARGNPQIKRHDGVVGSRNNHAHIPTITSAGIASGEVGMTFSYQITATKRPIAFGASGLPDGLTINTRTGVISGTPTSAAVTKPTAREGRKLPRSWTFLKMSSAW